MIRPRSPTTQAIIDLMAERLNQEDTLITYDELEKMFGKSVSALRPFIYSARNTVLNDHRKWFDCYRGVGFRVVLDEDLPECGKRHRFRTRNLNRQNIKILSTADPAKQSPEARRLTMVERSVAELGLAATSQRSIAKVTQLVTRTHNELTPEEQVEAIKNALVTKMAGAPARRADPQSVELTGQQVEAIKNALSRK
jgi:hypothetical protein